MILWLDRCASTNTEALARADVPDLRAVATHEQLAGRGRLGRQWLSAPAVCFSWIARPAFPLSTGGLLPLMTAVVLAEYCAALGVEATVKWPNDLLVDGRKLAGVLCEARADQTRWVAAVGIGLNLRTPAEGWPADVPGIALDACVDAPLAPEAVVAAIVERLEAALPGLASLAGRRALVDAWIDHAPPLGTPMRRGDLVGRFAGLGSDGALHLTADHGLVVVHTGDVQLLGEA